MYKQVENQEIVWYSEFPPVKGAPQKIDETHPVVAVTSFHGFTGGHASLYLEQLVANTNPILVNDVQGNPVDLGPSFVAIVHKIHLKTVQEYVSGHDDIEVLVEEKDRNRESRLRAEGLYYKSWQISNPQVLSIFKAIEKFNDKAANGRYNYRRAGGFLGYLSTRPGQRGINCADVCIKILKDAGVATVGNNLINSPRLVATSTKWVTTPTK